MNIEQLITTPIYLSGVADDATYVDASGAERAVRVVSDTSSGSLLEGLDIGPLGARQRFFVRKSDVRQPAKGDTVVFEGVRYCVEGFEPPTPTEWHLMVRAV